MGKIARELSAPSDDNMAKPENARPQFDSKVWVIQDDGAYINTKTGEVRDVDEFARPGEVEGESGEDSDIFHDDDPSDDSPPANAAAVPEREPNPLKSFRVSQGKPRPDATKKKGKAA